MRLFSQNPTLHHFKIIFPIPVEKIQNCLKKLQHINSKNSSAVCISLSGHSQSPQACQLLHSSILNLRDINRLSVYTFLEDKATTLTYFTATAGQSISANPYTLIGDIGSTQKTYRNIKKLLDLIGIKYTQLGSKNESSQIWNQFVQKSQRQKQITKKWIDAVQKNLIQSVAQNRKLLKSQVEALRNKIFNPKEALKAKLIDNITTFQQFSALQFPNHNIEDVVYRLDGTRIRSTLTQRQISALKIFFQVLEMPSVALFTSEDLLISSIKEIIQLFQIRLENYFIEDMFKNLEGKISQKSFVF